MPDIDVVKRIKDLCKAYSWTYYRLAKESGITYSTLNAMMNKGTIPSIPTLSKICNGFGISISQFFAEDEPAPALSEAQKQHLESWNNLTDANKSCVNKFTSFLQAEQRNHSD